MKNLIQTKRHGINNVEMGLTYFVGLHCHTNYKIRYLFLRYNSSVLRGWFPYGALFRGKDFTISVLFLDIAIFTDIFTTASTIKKI